MKLTIWKYPIEITDFQEILMPEGARVLNVVEMQYGTPCLWAIVEPEKKKVPRHIIMHGTGHDATDIQGCTHLGSFLLNGGALVFHVFIEGRNS